MMKQITLTLALCLFLTGCSDKVARQYAEELTRLMDEYSKRVDHLISGETKRYREDAQALETARTEAVLDKLSEDRRILVTRQYLDGLVDGKADADRFVNTVLLEYAERDYTATREIYTKLDTAYTAHLSAMQPLAADRAKSKILRNAFADLAKEPNVVDLATQFGKFGTDLKSNLEFERCTDLTAEVAELTSEVAKITEKKNAATAGSPERLALEAVLTSTTAELATVTAQRVSTGRFVGTQCTRP